jgi:hypothetical protein
MEFGFEFYKLEFTRVDDTIHAKYPIPEQMNSIRALYVYSDIVKYQNVGDSCVPLLRVVPVDNAIQFGEYITRTFTTPHYVPVLKRNINTIEIDIKTDYSERIHFGIGKVYVQLHFRPKRHF